MQNWLGSSGVKYSLRGLILNTGHSLFSFVQFYIECQLTERELVSPVYSSNIYKENAIIKSGKHLGIDSLSIWCFYYRNLLLIHENKILYSISNGLA